MSRVLIAFGIFLVNSFLFSGIAFLLVQAIYHIDIQALVKSADLLKPGAGQIAALRLFQGVASFGSFVVSGVIIALAFRQKPVEYLGLTEFPKPFFWLVIPVLLLVSMPFLSWILEWNERLQLPSFLSGLETQLRSWEGQNERMYELMLTMNNSSDLIANLVVMALIPALGEELFCRGVLLNILYDYTGKFFRSVVWVALIFTLFHLQIYKFLPMMALAVILGLFIRWTQSLWASILFHFLNNCFFVIASYLYSRGYKNAFTDSHVSVPIWLTLLSFLLTIAIIVTLNKRTKRLQTDHE